MPKYRVIYSFSSSYCHDVEAENEEDAELIADSLPDDDLSQSPLEWDDTIVEELEA